MTFFFLVVGLEAKRELDTGELRERRRLAIPVVAAVGGMALPIAIYLAFNAGGAGAHGWGAAMSTDTAFALGVLALVAPGGTRLRVRLLTLAVVDDLVALVVIATVYTEHLSVASARGRRRPLRASCSRSATRRSRWRRQAAVVARRRASGSRCSSPASIPSSPGSRSGSSRAPIRRRAATSSG